MSKTVLVEYIGRQKNRVDDVLHTNRIWELAGSILPIPAEEAPSYLRHALEWREISTEEASLRDQARGVVAERMAEIKSNWGAMTISDLEALKVDIDARIQEIRDVTVAQAIVAPPAPVNAPVINAADTTSDDAATAAAAAEKLEKIMAVIKDMDRNNDEEWSNRGPRVSVVSDRAGFPVRYEDVQLAMAAMKV